jgi:hypothetical protein
VLFSARVSLKAVKRDEGYNDRHNVGNIPDIGARKIMTCTIGVPSQHAAVGRHII